MIRYTTEDTQHGLHRYSDSFRDSKDRGTWTFNARKHGVYMLRVTHQALHIPLQFSSHRP